MISHFFLERFFSPRFIIPQIVLQDFVGWIRCLFFSHDLRRVGMDRWISKELAALGANALLHLAGMAVPWRWSVGLRTHLAQGDRYGRMTESTDGTTRLVFSRGKKEQFLEKSLKIMDFVSISWMSFSWEDFEVAPLREKKQSNRWDVFRSNGLVQVEDTLTENGGPFFLGERFSLVDIMCPGSSELER